jgi:hypothetical protein
MVRRRCREIARCLLATALVAGGPASAAGLVTELKGGILYHDVGGLWSGFRLEDEPIDINVEAILSPSMPLLWGYVHPTLGASINTGGDTSHVYLDARWQTEFATGLFVGIGLGAAVHDGKLDPTEPDRKALGSRVLFHIPAEIGLRLDAHNSLSVYFEHTSNANLAEFNEGMDRIGLRYGYRF